MSKPEHDVGRGLKLSIETRFYEDGMVEQRTLDIRQEVTLSFLNTKEAHIRKALIALGWTPPPLGFMPKGGRVE